MSDATPSVDQLKRALQITEQIARLEAELKAVLSGSSIEHAPVKTTAVTKPVKRKSGISAAGRARIAAAQKARWAEIKSQKAAVAVEPAPAAKAPKKGKRKISPEGRAKMAAAAKKRWAKAKKEAAK